MALTIDFSKFDKKLSELIVKQDKIVSDALKETAEQAIKTIVQRTRRKSQDKDGQAFAPYSESYLKQRKKAGASSRVTLTSPGATVGGSGRRGKLKGNKQGGAMLNSLTIERVEENGNRYVITAARGIELEKLRLNVRGAGNLPKRNPMGFTNAEDKLLTNRASRQILFKIRKIGLK